VRYSSDDEDVLDPEENPWDQAEYDDEYDDDDEDLDDAANDVFNSDDS